jgi:hypothetical protein
MLMFFFWVAQVAPFLWAFLVFFFGWLFVLKWLLSFQLLMSFFFFFFGVVAGLQVAPLLWVIHVFVGLLLVFNLLLFFELQNNWSLTKN